MKVFIITSSLKKEIELSRYFKNIGIKTTHLISKDDFNIKEIDKHNSILLVSEQTQLLSKKDNTLADLNVFQEVVHKSTVYVTLLTKEEDKIKKVKKEYKASVDGILSPSQKTNRSDIYNWDDIFISEKSMIPYQEMKDKGIKNSARDLAFSQFISDMEHIFKFENKVNLNFNKAAINEVVSFEPFIQDLLNNNPYYKLCKDNDFFSNILSNIIEQGIFFRRASDRSQRNYWLPGLNAGIPLTPKKDPVHEATFMFHDIMHFIFPDLIVTDESKESRNKYIISRMMSEAFTIVLADMFFISLLDDANIEYDFNKRKIYPLFEEIKFNISLDNIDKIKNLLWANTCFALLGEEEHLEKLVGDKNRFEEYKNKYQRFFQEDYKWTNENYKNIVKNSHINKEWYEKMTCHFPGVMYSAKDYAPQFNIYLSLKEQVSIIFEEMFAKIILFTTNKGNTEKSLTNAFCRYMIGQMNIFYKYETVYNRIFIEELIDGIMNIENNKDIEKVKNIYNMYLNKLVCMDLITTYDFERFKNIFPVFEPFYVFYESKKEESFNDILNNIFNEDK